MTHVLTATVGELTGGETSEQFSRSKFKLEEQVEGQKSLQVQQLQYVYFEDAQRFVWQQFAFLLCSVLIEGDLS